MDTISETILGKCVAVDTEEVSKMIQELTFKVGLTWCDNCKDYYLIPQLSYGKFISFDEDEGGNIFFVKTPKENYHIISLDETVRLLKLHTQKPKPPEIFIMSDGQKHKVEFEEFGIKIGCTSITKDKVAEIAEAVKEWCK